jgi:radical SAM-linked protein
MVRSRVRLRFTKQGDLRLIGHRDLMRCFERLFRRAGLPLGMSEGFHPKPRVTFPLPLSVGIDGSREVMELELSELIDSDELLQRLNTQVPRGLTIVSAETLPPGAKKAQALSSTYQVPVPPSFETGLGDRIDELLAQETYPITRTRGRADIDLRRYLEELSFDNGELQMRLKIEQKGSVGPRDVLKVLGLEELESHGVHLTRIAVDINN